MLSRVAEIIRHACDSLMYGKITICFEKGKIVRVVREESIKL